MTAAEELDVLVLGAGLSGINAAYRLRTEMPGASFAVFEARDVIGGTWSFFKYPGFRCDAVMTNFGFWWHPWPHDRKIVEAGPIVGYMEDAVKTNGLDMHIRLQHRVVSCDWNSSGSRWTVTVDVRGERKVFKAGWLLACTGYYSYERAFETHIPGIERFDGVVAHPQWWPSDLDCTDKRVVIVGSGATSMTLFPVLAKTAAQTTLVQRSPSNVFSLPTEHALDKFLKLLLPLQLVHWIAALKDLLIETLFIGFLLSFPALAKSFIAAEAKKQLPEDYAVDMHFNPDYNPFEKRLCMSPDGDVFKALHRPNAEIVTDTIESVEPGGVRIASSGRLVPADVIVTATGLHIQLFGHSTVSVDGVPVSIGERYIWRGFMVEGVPNAAAIIGYFTNTWTPGADAVTRIAIKVMKDARAQDTAAVTPVLSDEEKKHAPMKMPFDSKSNYVLQARERMPRCMDRGPWYGRKNVVVDLGALWFGNLRAGLRFDGRRNDAKTKDD